jgi:hypothetical protein
MVNTFFDDPLTAPLSASFQSALEKAGPQRKSDMACVYKVAFDVTYCCLKLFDITFTQCGLRPLTVAQMARLRQITAQGVQAAEAQQNLTQFMVEIIGDKPKYTVCIDENYAPLFIEAIQRQISQPDAKQKAVIEELGIISFTKTAEKECTLYTTKELPSLDMPYIQQLLNNLLPLYFYRAKTYVQTVLQRLPAEVYQQKGLEIDFSTRFLPRERDEYGYLFTHEPQFSFYVDQFSAQFKDFPEWMAALDQARRFLTSPHPAN